MTILTLRKPLFNRKSFSTTKRRTRISFITSLNWQAIFLFLIVSFSALYLFSVNLVAIKGYQIRDIEKEKNALKKEIKDLEMKTFSLKSLERVKEFAENSAMVPVGKIEYLEPEKKVVAAK